MPFIVRCLSVSRLRFTFLALSTIYIYSFLLFTTNYVIVWWLHVDFDLLPHKITNYFWCIVPAVRLRIAYIFRFSLTHSIYRFSSSAAHIVCLFFFYSKTMESYYRTNIQNDISNNLVFCCTIVFVTKLFKIIKFEFHVLLIKTNMHPLQAINVFRFVIILHKWTKEKKKKLIKFYFVLYKNKKKRWSKSIVFMWILCRIDLYFSPKSKVFLIKKQDVCICLTNININMILLLFVCLNIIPYTFIWNFINQIIKALCKHCQLWQQQVQPARIARYTRLSAFESKKKKEEAHTRADLYRTASVQSQFSTDSHKHQLHISISFCSNQTYPLLTLFSYRFVSFIRAAVFYTYAAKGVQYTRTLIIDNMLANTNTT